jgi:hypothetical protein
VGQLIAGVLQIGLEHETNRWTVAEFRPIEQVEHAPRDGFARVERLHVHMEVRAELTRRPQEVAQSVPRARDPPLRSIRAEVSGKGRELDREVCSRQPANGIEVEQWLSRPAASGSAKAVKCRETARGIPFGLLLRNGCLTEQIQRIACSCAPQFHEWTDRSLSVGSDDEPPAQPSGTSQTCGPGKPPWEPTSGGPVCEREARRRILQLAQEAVQVAAGLVAGAAGGCDIYEPEERSSHVGPLPRPLHHALVEPVARRPTATHPPIQLEADLLDRRL